MHGHRDILPLGLLPLGLRVLDGFRSLCRMKEFGDEFGCLGYARLFISCRKLQLSPLEHCPLAFHYQQSPSLLCSRLCSSGSSPALTVRLSRRTPGPFHPRVVLPRPASRTHPLPATPFQCPRSRTATLG